MSSFDEIKKEREYVPDFMYIQRLEDYIELLESKLNESLKNNYCAICEKDSKITGL